MNPGTVFRTVGQLAAVLQNALNQLPEEQANLIAQTFQRSVAEKVPAQEAIRKALATLEDPADTPVLPKVPRP